MTRIQIENHQVLFDGKFLDPRNSFEEILTLLGSRADVVMAPDEDGYGCIECRNVTFYGVTGYAELSFRKFQLTSLWVTSQWMYYDITDEAGNRPSVYQGANIISQMANQKLQASLGTPRFLGEAASVYVSGDIKIHTSMSREEDAFLTCLSWDANVVPSLGYALAPKQLVEQRMKVRYCYRDQPDEETDSGWRFFSGYETQEMVDDPDQIGLYDISIITETDPDVIPLLGWPYGSALEREDPADPFRRSPDDD